MQQDLEIENARRRLKTAYETRYALDGGYRAMQRDIHVNIRYLHDFMVYGHVPPEQAMAALLRWRPKPPRPMDADDKKLLALLMCHIGEPNALKKRDLLRLMWGSEIAEIESYNSRWDRTLRAKIEYLVRHHGALICSNSFAGYWYASSLKEGLAAVERSTRRARSQLDNAAHLKRNIIQHFGGQQRFPESEDEEEELLQESIEHDRDMQDLSAFARGY